MVLLFFLLAGFFASAQSPAEISLDLKADTFYAGPGDTFQLVFTLNNPMPAGDNTIDRMDVHLLGLKTAGLQVVGWEQNGWLHSFDAKFEDDRFFITNATSQTLTITLKATAQVKTSSIIGSYAFQKLSGTQFLKTPSEFNVKVNAVAAGQAQAPSKTQIPLKEQEQNNIIMIESIAIIALLAVVAFLAFKKNRTKQAQEAQHFSHRKK